MKSKTLWLIYFGICALFIIGLFLLDVEPVNDWFKSAWECGIRQGVDGC